MVLARPDDAALRDRVASLLPRLTANSGSGVAQVIDRAQIKALGGASKMDFFVDGRIGYTLGSKLIGPLVTPGTEKGTHGYFPAHPEMRATLILQGPNITAHGSLGEVDMRDVAPTVAKLLDVAFPSAEGEPLF